MSRDTLCTVCFAAGVACALAVSCGLSRQDAKTALQAVDVSTEACKTIAETHGRKDIAEYCGVAGGLVPVIDKLLSEAQSAKESQAIREASCTVTVQLDGGVVESGRDELEQRK